MRSPVRHKNQAPLPPRKLPFFWLVLSPILAIGGGVLAFEMADIFHEAARAAQAKEEKKASDRPVAYVGAKLHRVSGPPIEDGVLVVQKGKILAVGSRAETKIPAGAEVRDLKGKVVIPGLVDTHSHVGIFPRPQVSANQDGNEMTGPIQPGLRAIDSIHPGDPGIKMALAGGVTTANIMPGSGNAIGGQTVYVKFRGVTIEAMRILMERVLGGIKFANGENPKGVYGKKNAAPGTRMKIAALQREALTKARSYKSQLDRFQKEKNEGKSPTPPERDLAMEPLVEVLEKRRTVHFHCHRADDIMTAVRLADEFGFELVLQHWTEGYRVAEELAKRGIIVSLTLVDSPGGKPEVMGLLEENAAVLAKAGVKVCINTDDFVTESRFFLRTGAIAVRGGMTEDQALKALTLHGAEAMHLSHRLGSLDAGKDADFVILSGAPFSVYTQVLETYIEGEKMFDRSIHRDWTYQAGGFALSDSKKVSAPGKFAMPPAKTDAPNLPDGAAAFKDAPKSYAVIAGTLHVASGPALSPGVVLVEDGKVKQVGKLGDVAIPAGTPTLTASVVTPGMIDAHSVVGISGALNFAKADQDQDEMSDPNQADLRVLDSFNPNEPLLQFIRENGTTIVHVMPGRANAIAGQTGVFRTHGRTAEQMTVRFPAGLLVNLGEVPKSSYPGKLPNTRMGTANLVRTAFAQAEAYGRKKQAKEPPPPNMKHEAMLLALSGKAPVIFAAHRADDILTGLRIAKEFKAKPMLALATEGYLVADQLREAKAPLLLHPTMQRPAAIETFNSILGNAAVLSKGPAPVAITTAFEGYVPKTRVLRFEAAMAMVNGLGYDAALRSITVEPAKILGIDAQYGSLAPGKVADLVLFDGDPFEHATHVTHTIMNGRVIYDRADYLKLPLERRMLAASGGGGDWGCCLGAW